MRKAKAGRPPTSKRRRAARVRRRTPLLVLARRIVAAALALTAVLLVLKPAESGPPAGTQPPALSVSAPPSSPVPAAAVAVPIRLSDPGIVALLRPGVHVDLYAGEPGAPLVLLGADLLVAIIPKPVAGSATIGARQANEFPGLIVLAVTSDEAVKVVSASTASLVVVTLSAIKIKPGQP